MKNLVPVQQGAVNLAIKILLHFRTLSLYTTCSFCYNGEWESMLPTRILNFGQFNVVQLQTMEKSIFC